jgi:hypothetical protein
MSDATLLERARPQTGDKRLVRLVAGIKAAAADRTLQQIAAQLEAMHERTPSGGTRWHPLFGQTSAGNGGTHRIGRSKSRSGPLRFNANDEATEWKTTGSECNSTEDQPSLPHDEG